MTKLSKNRVIRVRGAREHNLKDIDVDLPRDELIVITGLSGSGKSSLAFDTIYAEGQRRYVESLSAYARQFLDMMEKPDVDLIEGLSPAISIEQKTTHNNPRSTVGTVTEVYDYMRLLWARAGVPYSPATGKPITSQTVSQMVDQVEALDDGTRIYILSPIVRGRKGEYKKEMRELRKAGFQRLRINGEIYEIDETPDLDKKLKHDIEVVVDRLVVSDDMGNRLPDSIETALDLSDGLMYVDEADTKGEGDDDNNIRHVFSAKFACPVSGFTIEEIEPRLFSFNSPFGACSTCDGLGFKDVFDPELIVPDPDKSLADGAIAPWPLDKSPYYLQTLKGICNHFDTKTTLAWRDLDDTVQTAILHGTGGKKIELDYDDGLRQYTTEKPFEGVIPNLQRRYGQTNSKRTRQNLEKYMSSQACEACDGYRLNRQARAVKVNDYHIGQAAELSIKDALDWFDGVEDSLSKSAKQIAAPILKEIQDRLTFLADVGLTYLTLARTAGTLSGGESQRIRLASQIGSGLTGVLYVLDEPSIGLHQRDNDRLLNTLKRLRDLGNTVLVVEHDEDAIRSADYLVDMGPGAGVQGGDVIAAGTPGQVFENDDSLTAQYITGKMNIPVPEDRRAGARRLDKNGDETGKVKQVTIERARGNNLQDVTASIPLGTFTCITGVSGSGKSTLVMDTFYNAAARRVMNSRTVPAAHDRIRGLNLMDKIIDIDQSPIGRTPRSNPATYTGAFTPIREWFAGLPESKARGYDKGRFSFNVKGGRCEACSGDGVQKIEMHFLADVYVKCDVCDGRRYNRETLEIKYKGKSIYDVLEMTVAEARDFFSAVPKIVSKLETLESVGLGYIKIGQPATTLSGGEAQRVKLSKELARRSTGKTMYILDEPTTGLHFHDVRKLLDVLHELVDKGNTVVVIEHNLEVIKTSDHIIDLGPDGGDLGGQIIATGTPEQVAEVDESHTGQYLKTYLGLADKPEQKKAS